MLVSFIYTKSAVDYSKWIEVLALRGLTEPDELQKVGVTHDLLDGVLEEQVRGFRKIITARVSPVASAADRRFVSEFILAESKQIAKAGYVSNVVNESNESDEKEALVSEWLYDCEYNRAFNLRLIDSHVYTKWDERIPAVADELMYLKNQVLITGTLASPESFETNVGKLEFQETGESYPAFDDATHVFRIDIAGKYQERAAGIVKDSIAVSGGNLTFQVARDNVGQDYDSAGNCYYDIEIRLEEIPV